MSYIRILMSIKDFIPYVKDILLKNDANLYVEKRENKTQLQYININLLEEILPFEANREQYTNLYITTTEFNVDKDSFYKTPINLFSCDITGGREKNDEIEIINIRILSKTPDKSIKKVFNSIKYRLNHDENIGKGVKIDNSTYKMMYYLKTNVENKTYSFDFYNESFSGFNIIVE
ncbi:hypothetical protein ACYSNM_13295 [Myroides sp. LJL116]